MSCACQRNGRANEDQPARQHPRRRQRANGTKRHFDGVRDAFERLCLQNIRIARAALQDIVNLFIFHDSPPLCPFLNAAALMVSLNFL